MLIQSGKSTGLESKNTGMIRISPNPIEKTASMTFPGLTKNQEKQLSLFDFTGRLVFKDSFNSEVYLFDRGTISSGIYILKVIYQKDKPPFIAKMILE